jgi:hypothetical protein
VSPGAAIPGAQPSDEGRASQSHTKDDQQRSVIAFDPVRLRAAGVLRRSNGGECNTLANQSLRVSSSWSLVQRAEDHRHKETT